MRRDPLTVARHRVAVLEDHLKHMRRCVRDTRTSEQQREWYQHDIARHRDELAKAAEVLRSLRMRELNGRLERIRRPRWTVPVAVQLSLFDGAPDTPPDGGEPAPGTPIGPGFRLTRERLGLHLADWPEEAPGTVPVALEYAVMCEERRRDLVDPAWDALEAEPAEAVPTALEEDVHEEPEGCRVVFLPRPTCPTEHRPHLLRSAGGCP